MRISLAVIGKAIVIALAAFTSGCTWFQNDASRGFVQTGKFDQPIIYTTADVRLVTQRIHPVTGQPVLCTEPSPDVAKALSTASQISASGGNKGASGSLGIGGGSAEAAAELAGRSTALLAYVDGLYHTVRGLRERGTGRKRLRVGLEPIRTTHDYPVPRPGHRRPEC